MKRKNNWNLLGVIVLIAMCAFMFISCQQGPTLNPYKTLTLDIEGQKQTLYYGDDRAWYNALSEGGLLIDDNKVTGDDIKFNISETTKWTVTFKKNIPDGASESDFTITPASVDVTSELSLSDDSFIDITTGKVSVDSISEDVTITGKYPPAAIGQDVIASSTNVNYEFEKWTVNGKTIDNIADYEVSGKTEIVANWKNVSPFKVLTVKDGDIVKDTVYYNKKDGKWYKERSTTSEVITSVALPDSTTKTYTITLKYNDKVSEDGISTLNSTFSGYGESGADSANILASGELANYTIDEDTELVSLWSEPTFNKPSDPTRDGYTFNGWYNGDVEYNFDDVVTGDMTLTAHWKENLKKLTVKDGVNEIDTAWYSSEDNKWYADEKMTGEKTSVRTLPNREYTITLDYDNNGRNETRSEKVIRPFSGYEDGSEVKVHADGSLSGYRINEDTELVSKWDEVKFTKPSDPTKDGYNFDAWYKDGTPYDFNNVVTEDMTLTANWTKKTFKTLTLDIAGQKQELYYGSDSAWYKAVVGEEHLLLNDNKVTGDDIKFNISETTKWTVTFNKNTPAGANADEILISRESVVLTPKLSLSPDNVIDKTSGKVLPPSSISEDVTITGTYPPKAIGESVTAESTNQNYEFAGWTVNGKTIDNITDYEVSGNTEIVANWNNTSDFKVLAVKDGYEIVETVYYYTRDGKWYKERSTSSEVITSVALPDSTTKTYTLTLNYDDTHNGNGGSVTTSFLGYGLDGNTRPVIEPDGLLKDYTIENDTVFVSKWKEVKFTKPSDPTRDGYVFDKWTLNDTEYNFESAVTDNITLVAVWTKKTFKTLTLNITDSDTQTLYYGSDNAWYKALGEGDLLLDDNKVTGDGVKFIMPSAPTWTVTFDKNIPDGASESEFTITRESVVLKPELSLSPDDLIDNTGKVIPSSISGHVTVTGTYPSKVIRESVTASSTNLNYEFEKWTANGEDITDITNYKVNGDTNVVANWKNISSFKVLTVKDGDVVKDTAYYNATDKKWYVSNDITSGEKTSVPTLPNREYTITLDYANGSSNGSEKVTSSFLGYGTNDNTSAVIGTNGLLSSYTINEDTELVSKWNEEKFTKPENPTRDGYVFDKWYNGDVEYNFDNVVTGDITITAHWTKKTFNTLTLNIAGQEQTLYYGSDNAWYSDVVVVGEDQLLLDRNKITGENVKFNIPSAPTWTVRFDKNIPDGASESEFTVSANTKTVTPDLTLTPDNTVDASSGKVKVENISEDTIVTGEYLATAIGESVTASSTNANYEFEKWTANGEDITDTTNYKVNGDTNVVANWKNISSFKVLTVKDGESKDTAYYNVTDKKWYVSNDITSGEKTSVTTPQDREYTITLNYDNSTPNGNEKVISSFRGYGVGSEVKVPSNGSLSGCTISDATVLVSLWSEAKFNEPSEQPTKDGYVFNGWYNGESPYNFGNVVTGNMTLVAHWTKKTFNTLTLNIEGQKEQKLYYGSDNVWYKALSEGGLLLNDNKVTGEDVKFNIPELVWKVTFDKNAPNGASESDFTITPAFVDVTPELSLSPSDLIDNTGKVIANSIIENVTVIGTYPSKTIGDSVTPSTGNANYEFDKWTTEGGEEITDITSYPVSGNITIKANWKNISSFKVLAVKDGNVVKDTAYYNTKDHKWYAGSDITSGEKLSVPTLPNIEYTITLNYDNDSPNGSEKVIRPFSGYEDGSEVKVQADGLLKDYTIENDTELVSKWDEVKFKKPSDPTRDGYLFDKWYNGDVEYNFDSVVTGDMTLTAHWKEKPKKLTVKDRDVVKDTAYYNLTDKKWYANENMTEEKTSVDIPQDRTYTLTLDYDNGDPNGNGGSVASSFRGYGTNDNTSAVIGINGSLSGYTISDATELVSLWSEAKFKEPSEQPTKDGYVFDKWYKDGSPYDFNSVVEGNMTLTAHWTKKTFNTLTLNITDSGAQTLYYGSDSVWYNAVVGEEHLLLDRNKITGDVKFNIPSTPTWTLTLNKNRPQNAPFSDDAIILSQNQLTLYPKDGVFSTDEYISKDGIVKVPSITGNVDVTLDTSRRYPSENVEATISRDDIKFLGWKIGDQTITDLSTYEVTADNITLNASWGYKVSIGELNVYYDRHRGFYNKLAEIEVFDKDESKQIRVAYYAEGEWVHFFYDDGSIRDKLKINLKNEWSGETTEIKSDPWRLWAIVNIHPMPNYPLSISFEMSGPPTEPD